MKQKILNQVGGLLIASILFTFLIVSLSMYNKFDDYMGESVEEETEYIRLAIEKTDGRYLADELKKFSSKSRVTLLAEDGTVLYDSLEDASRMNNHGDRPEFQGALENGSYSMTRYSSTYSKQTYYHAVRLTDGTVLRLARTTDSVLASVQSSITLMGLLVFAIIIIAFFVVQKQTNQLIEPINKMDLEHPLRHVEYEELRPLLLRVHEQNKQIAHQVEELKERHEEYMAITENMKDGLVVANQTDILSMNKVAQEVFHMKLSDSGRKPISYVNRNKELRESLQKALAGEEVETILETGGKSYQLLANPVKVSGKIFGAVVLVWDITVQQQAERMRREFSANVSHELKTPLMSISGYAELIENGMVQPEDIQNFAGRIHQEASRLTEMVQDIIQLSKLEEGKVPVEKEKISLWDITEEIKKNLFHAAEKRKISVCIEGQDAEIEGVRQVLYEMLYNLMDNGIKYNKENGWLKVRIWEEEKTVYWQAEDNGIGIAKEDQERIYERFYRVDKSHSRQTGGTGLGLAIVKHGAAMHHAAIQTESQLGKGTTITMEFPK